MRIDRQQADALIGCDLVVSSSPKASGTYRVGHTRAVVNSTEMSTADFVMHRDASLRAGDRVRAIADIVGEQNLSTVAANRLAERLLGDTIYANVLMAGFAWQHGLLPLSRDALERAIELNGVKVAENIEAFNWGRIAAADPAFVDNRLGGERAEPAAPETLEETVGRRSEFLAGYQNRALADKYENLISGVREAEEALLPGSLSLTTAVAKSYFKTLAYKDEYEVARLHAESGFLTGVREKYGSDARITFHLAPPLIARQRDARGRPRKLKFGAWMIPMFRILAKLRTLRGTPFDVFGYSEERRMERALIPEFEAVVGQLLDRLDATNVEDATEIVSQYQEIRGYGPVKEAAAAETRREIERRLADFAGARQRAA